MTDDAANSLGLLRRATQGDAQALGELFGHNRDRLRRMVQLRLDRRLHSPGFPLSAAADGL